MINHIRYSICDSRICPPCITAIYDVMIKKNEHPNDVWYHHETQAIKTSDQSLKFIGHCCALKVSIEKDVSNNENCCPTTRNAGMLYDRYLDFSHLELLIKSSIVEFVDIHDLRKEDDTNVPGLIHGVINAVTTAYMFKNDCTPDASKCTELSTETKLVNYDTLMSLFIPSIIFLSCLLQS